MQGVVLKLNTKCSLWQNTVIKGWWHRQDIKTGLTSFCFLSANTEDSQAAVNSIK